MDISVGIQVLICRYGGYRCGRYWCKILDCGRLRCEDTAVKDTDVGIYVLG